jgi:hypothetical protein
VRLVKAEAVGLRVECQEEGMAQGDWPMQEDEAEPKRRGGPRALGFQSDLYNLKKKKKNFQMPSIHKITLY